MKRIREFLASHRRLVVTLALVAYSACTAIFFLAVATNRCLPKDRAPTALDWLWFGWSFLASWLVGGAGVIWLIKALEAAQKINAWYIQNCVPNDKSWIYRNELKIYTTMMICSMLMMSIVSFASDISLWRQLAIIACGPVVVSYIRFGLQSMSMTHGRHELCEFKARRVWGIVFLSSVMIAFGCFVMIFVAGS